MWLFCVMDKVRHSSHKTQKANRRLMYHISFKCSIRSSETRSTRPKHIAAEFSILEHSINTSQVAYSTTKFQSVSLQATTHETLQTLEYSVKCIFFSLGELELKQNSSLQRKHWLDKLALHQISVDVTLVTICTTQLFQRKSIRQRSTHHRLAILCFFSDTVMTTFAVLGQKDNTDSKHIALDRPVSGFWCTGRSYLHGRHDHSYITNILKKSHWA